MAALYEPRDSPRIDHIEFLSNLWLPANRERNSKCVKARVRWILKRAREIRQTSGFPKLPA
jgi:hypothetical protein